MRRFVIKSVLPLLLTLLPVLGGVLIFVALPPDARRDYINRVEHSPFDWIILGLGFGGTTQVLVLAAQNAVEPRDIGVATSTATFMRQMGGTFGAAIFGSVLATQLTANLREAFPNGPPAGVDSDAVTGSPATIAALPDAVRTDVIDAFVGAVQMMFTVAVPFVLATTTE